MSNKSEFLLVLFLIFQVVSCAQKKAIVLGQTGSGKSTLCNFLVGNRMFKAKASSESVTLKIQEGVIDCEDYILTVIDTPGFTDPKNLDNWDVLNKITAYIKTEKIDLVILVINYSVRASNEEYILKWLYYSLPLNNDNSLIVINQYRDIQEFCYNSSDQCPASENEQSENDEENQLFIDFIKKTFQNSQITQIGYNPEKSLTNKQFLKLVKTIKETILPSAKMDHSLVFNLDERIKRELDSNSETCFQKYYVPELENIKKEIVGMERNILEVEGIIQVHERSIQHTRGKMNMKPKGSYKEYWVAGKKHYYHTQEQINLMMLLGDDLSNERLRQYKQISTLERLKEKLGDIETKSQQLITTIPELKLFKSCLREANEGIRDMIEVKTYFEALNPQKKSKNDEEL